MTDRRAVPSILKLFPVDRPEAEQLRRVRLLGQIDDPSSSRAIADQAVWTRFDSVRREAIEILKRRPPRDYAGNLVEMIHGTIRYEVQPVSGPNSRGALAIEAPRFRMLRTYDVPPAFELASSFRGYVGYDDNGLPIVAQGMELDYMKRQIRNPQAIAAKVREIEIRTANMLAQATRGRSAARWPPTSTPSRWPTSRRVTTTRASSRSSSPPPAHRRASATTRMRGTAGGSTRSATAIRHPPKPTFTQDVVPQYQPYSIRTCFAAGTPVHTLDGARPIEAIQVGDQVLSQDAATGALSFQPVVFVHRNPPAKTLRIRLSDGESVVCSVYHRFWRANLGWAQARELKPGDSPPHLRRHRPGRSHRARLRPAPL